MMRNHTTDTGRRAAIFAAVAALAVLGALALAGSASARTVYKWVYAGNYPANSFNGSDAVPNDVTVNGGRDIQVDQANNAIYAALSLPEVFGEPLQTRLYKYNFEGHSVAWSSIEPQTWLPQSHANRKFAVDNSGGPTQGRIYAASTRTGDEQIYAFLPSGQEYTGGNFPIALSGRDTCGIAVDPQGNIWIDHNSFNIGLTEPNGTFEEFSPEGVPSGKKIYAEALDPGSEVEPCGMEFDSQGNLYYDASFTLRSESGGRQGSVAKYSPQGVKYRSAIDPEFTTITTHMAVDRSDDDLFVFVRGGEGTGTNGPIIRQYNPEGGLVGSFGNAEGSFPGISGPSGIAVDDDTHTVFVANSGRIDKFIRTEPIQVAIAKTKPADVTPTSAVLHGIANGDGNETTECFFEWGTNVRVENKAPCAEGNVFSGGSGDHAVHAEITGLTKATEYHYRLAVTNANGTARGAYEAFRASTPPTVTNVSATNIDTGGAHLDADVVPNGSITHYRFEVGTEAGNYTLSAPANPPANAIYEWTQTTPKHIDVPVSGLEPESTYHWRFVAENDAGTVTASDQVFHTFAKDPEGDKCANAHTRQQTGTRLLLDCRAYELVSAANAGGYDVESNLTVGEVPLISSPLVDGRLLYSLHYGSVPNIAGNPTDFGHDPYLAVRDANGGWSTQYVGLPANGMADKEPYGSPLLGSDGGLTEFAFGGENICEPCFADGSSNIPLRRADGTIEKGMKGSQEPAGDPSGKVSQPFSGDGSHLIFGSTSLFDSKGDPGGSIYDRDLTTGTTQVASTLPNGSTMTGGQVAELGVSSDGSRIVVAQKVGTDAKGNAYWHPYMHIGNSPNTVDLAPGTTNGVLWAGMSADGTKVFYATKDKLVGGDGDNSADIYEADVSGSGPATLSLVSTNGVTPSNADGCAPTEEWNVASGGPNCGALPLAGGAGISANGSVYFLSPEQLDGSEGEANEPNLYVRRPGQPTQFVATLDTAPIDNPAVLHALSQAETHSYGDFQVSADGRYALFSAARSLTGYPNGGHYLLYRYDAQEDELTCTSCPVTGITASASTFPPPYGLGLTDDGLVFFTTDEQLVLRDTNNKADAYEWTENGGELGHQQLISSGSSPLNSSFLGASADGTDAFFFTHEVLTPEDENGNAVKVYDARASGGFPFLPAAKPCAASDECHGPGTEQPGPPNINTFTGGGTGRGNATGREGTTKCRKGFVKRNGHCVKRKKHRHGRRHHSRRHARGPANG